MKNTPSRFYLLVAIFFIALLSACSALANQTSQTEATEALPTAITLPTQLSVQTRVESQTCLAFETAAIQTDKPQGDLMAWSPTSDDLALVQPVNQYSSWYIGNVLIRDAKTGEDVLTSDNSTVFGDLTWAQDGSSLAYVALEQQEEIYTIKWLTLADNLEVDIFGGSEGARTNDYASSKGIRAWTADNNLEVVSSCGVDCVRVYDYNPVSMSLLEQGDVRQNDDTSLALQNETISPDGRWSVYIDDDNDLWLTSTVDNRVSLLLVNTEVNEIKWSHDSAYLALRTAEQVSVYELGCTP